MPQRQNTWPEHTTNSPVRRRAAPYMSALLALGACGIIGLFLYSMGVFEGRPEPVPVPDARAGKQNQNQVTVSASTVSGFDKERQPYLLDAATAEQDPVKQNIVYMKKVKAKLHKLDGTRYHVDADGAVYDSAAKSLDLRGNVIVISQDRFVARMPQATVTLKDKRLYSDQPVEVTLPTGRITANGVEVTENGQHIVFFNRVKAVLHGKSRKEDSQ